MDASTKSQSRKPLGLAIGLVIAALAAVDGSFFAYLSNMPAGDAEGATCALCGMGRGRLTILGRTRTTYHATELSRWYEGQIEPQHTHIWGTSSNRATLNLFGESIGGGTGPPALIPIRLLSDAQRQRFLRHVTDIAALERLFADVHASAPRRIDDPIEDARGIMLVEAIRQWEQAGYPGTWDDWWNSWWGAWVSWMQSKGSHNFEGWRRLRMRDRASGKK